MGCCEQPRRRWNPLHMEGPKPPTPGFGFPHHQPELMRLHRAVGGPPRGTSQPPAGPGALSSPSPFPWPRSQATLTFPSSAQKDPCGTEPNLKSSIPFPTAPQGPAGLQWAHPCSPALRALGDGLCWTHRQGHLPPAQTPSKPVTARSCHHNPTPWAAQAEQEPPPSPLLLELHSLLIILAPPQLRAGGRGFLSE